MCDSHGVSDTRCQFHGLNIDGVWKSNWEGASNGHNRMVSEDVLTLPNAAIHNVQFRHQPGRFSKIRKRGKNGQ